MESDLSGQFQAENFRGVIQAVFILNQSGYEITDEEALTEFKKIKTSTHFMGRMQILKHTVVHTLS